MVPLWSVLSPICIFGFFKEFRPTTPYLTYHLIADKDFNATTLYGEIYPIWTYSYFCMLVPVLLLTDILRYRPIVIGEAAGFVATWILIVMGSSKADMQSMQGLYGWASAAGVAYASYSYAAVDAIHFRIAKNFCRGSALLSRCLACGLAQVILFFRLGDYFFLDYISLGAVTTAFMIALFLPGADLVWSQPNTAKLATMARLRSNSQPLVSESGNNKARRQQQTVQQQHSISVFSIKYVTSYLRGLFVKIFHCYSDRFVLKWAFWWALTLCGYLQTLTYIQIIWAELQPFNTAEIYNGLIEFINVLFGTGISISTQFLLLNWAVIGESALATCCAISSCLLILISRSGTVVIAYAAYIGICGLFQMILTIATYNVSSKLKDITNVGLVTGCNTFLALIFQSLLTLIIADVRGFNLDIRSQFLAYGIYHGALAVLFVIVAMATICSMGIRNFWNQAFLVSVKPDDEMVPTDPADDGRRSVSSEADSDRIFDGASLNASQSTQPLMGGDRSLFSITDDETDSVSTARHPRSGQPRKAFGQQAVAATAV